MIGGLIADGYRPYTFDLGFPGIDAAANSEKIGVKVDHGAGQVPRCISEEDQERLLQSLSA